MSNMQKQEAGTKPDDTTRSPLRTVQILHELARNPAGLTLADLSVRLELPKTSLFRLMRTLESGNYVVAGEGGYRMGPATLKLGAAIIQNRQFPNCAVPTMQAISDRCGETVILGTLADSRGEVLYAEVIDATNPLRFISKAGSTNPLYGSASGQILLAFMTQAELKHYLKGVRFVRHAPGTITTTEALMEKLSGIRATGVSASRDGLVEGVFSIATPIVDMAGKVIAGLSISAPSIRGLRQKGKLETLALDGGEEISRILGYKGKYPVPDAPI